MKIDEMINPVYFDEKAIASIKQGFLSEKELQTISMENFLRGEILNQFFEEIKVQEFVRERNPCKYSIFKAKTPIRIQRFLNSLELRDLIGEMIEEHIIDIQSHVIQIGWKNYTLIHDDIRSDNVFEFYLDFTKQWQEQFGGYISYYVPPDKYFKLPIKYGQFTVVHRRYGVAKFIKYVNNRAGSSKRYFISGRMITS